MIPRGGVQQFVIGVAHSGIGGDILTVATPNFLIVFPYAVAFHFSTNIRNILIGNVLISF
jgi:hypothetical protein